MKYKFSNLLLIGSIVASVVFSSCEKNDENAPVASFVASQTNIDVGTSIVFTDSSTYTPTTWSWDFGDGSTSIQQNPSHTYDSVGIFTVSLIVNNTYGSNTETKVDYITVSSNDSVDNLTDIDGNIYKIVTIGSQVWMAENLKVTHYPNGDAIPNISDNTDWSNLGNNDTDDAYCYYDNITVNAETYGALYTYAAAIGDDWARDNTENQGVCPDGWHLPTDTEWTTLINYLGGEDIAGGKMKEIGTTHWNSPNTGADNSSSFSALPGGFRTYSNGTFDGLGNALNLWSATEYDSERAYSRTLGRSHNAVSHPHLNKSYGYYIRCVKD